MAWFGDDWGRSREPVVLRPGAGRQIGAVGWLSGWGVHTASGIITSLNDTPQGNRFGVLYTVFCGAVGSQHTNIGATMKKYARITLHIYYINNYLIWLHFDLLSIRKMGGKR
jgi:hypothetical protein